MRRRIVMLALAGLSAWAVRVASAADGPLDKLLAEGSLANTRNPVPASFLLNEGGRHLNAEQRAAALDQLKSALKVQANPLHVMMQGAAGAMNSDSAKEQMKQMQQQSASKSILKSMLGMNSQPQGVDPRRAQAEAKEAVVDAWVRGIEAARALNQAGDAQAAANFYVDCLQMLQADWVPAACLDGILELGPRRAGLVLNWMVDNADTVSITNQANLGAPPPKRGKPLPDMGTVQLRQAALEGLGALVGGGQLAHDASETAIGKLLAYSGGKENEPFARGAALGLGRSRDPRAVEPLRRLAKDSRPEVKLAAWRGLAVAFHDEGAIRSLRGELDDHDLEAQLRAAVVLFEVGDETGLKWAVDTIGRRRTSDAKQADIRPQVVRSLVELAGARARPTLEQALAAGTGNDWLEAWARVGLLELGDTSQMPAVTAAVDKTDWSLDPRGFRSIWRAIKPLILAAAQTVLTGGMAAPSAIDQVRHAVQLISNFASGERGRYLANADARKAAIAQLRWQTADALAIAHPPGATHLLLRLVDDDVPAVRLSAARALAAVDAGDAIDGIVAAFGRDYGEEAGVSRTAEVRGALLRAAVIRFAKDRRVHELLDAGAADADPGVRFISLASLRPAT